MSLYSGSHITEVLFLGTGTSSGIPSVPCLVREPKKCKVCLSSVTEEGKRNKRKNTCILIKIETPEKQIKNVMIDCGKTFYESTIEFFPKHNIESIDAILLTHGHADAILGLDDMRPWTGCREDPLNLYLNSETYEVVARTFPYIVDTSKSTGGGEVPKLTFNLFENSDSIRIFGIDFTPLLVEHGITSPGYPYYAVGFKFDKISYIPDCSLIPEETREKMKDSDCLIVDSLKWTPHLSHYSFYQALDEILIHRPKLSLLTDFCHSIDHYEIINELETWQKDHGLMVAPAFDGLVIKVESGNLSLIE